MAKYIPNIVDKATPTTMYKKVFPRLEITPLSWIIVRKFSKPEKTVGGLSG
jgi:hypothetical protein